MSAEAVSKRKASTELVQRSEHVLSSVKAACVHDSEGFIDEVILTLCIPCHTMPYHAMPYIASSYSYSCSTHLLNNQN